MLLLVLVLGSDLRSLILPPKCECIVFADACSDPESVGMGVVVVSPTLSEHVLSGPDDGTVSVASARPFPTVVHRHLGAGRLRCPSFDVASTSWTGRLPIHVVFRSDNSASESACW